MPSILELTLYPVKSCGGIALHEATITETGLRSGPIHDREWMIVDVNGDFLTQRSHPRMALIRPAIKANTLELNAPGMPMLEIPLTLPDPDKAPTLQVRIWRDTVKAYDYSEIGAVWLSNFLETPCRLARAHPDARRIASREWTNGIEASTLFADGYPMLVVSEASLRDLNERLTAQGRAVLPMNRFRPNIVIEGIEAFEEDYVESFRVGDAFIKPVKPCPRCPIPSVDQTTGEFGPDPLDILRTYRTKPKVDGGITFGMNAILLEGNGQIVRVGQDVEVELAF